MFVLIMCVGFFFCFFSFNVYNKHYYKSNQIKTPIAALQIQSGLPTITEKIHEVQTNYYAKKIRTNDTKFIEGTQWEKKINKNLETYNIKEEELET